MGKIFFWLTFFLILGYVIYQCGMKYFSYFKG